MALVALTVFMAGLVLAEISPTTLTAGLDRGESVTETKTVTLPAVIPKADIIFAFDLTGSMSGEINTAKAEAINIMNSLDALIDDARYGVMSYMDYPDAYSSCGYSSTYGSPYWGDYAYRLDIPASADRSAVSAAINGLVLGGGSDGPQDYTRIFYESYADESIGYRDGAKKILINFGDNVPHDCNLNEGVTSGTWTTGGDPGRDEIMGTADDLDLQTVLAEMAANGVTLLEIHSTSYASDYWDYWTGITGGDVYVLSSASEVPAAIISLVEGEATFISNLTIEVTTPGYGDWLTSVVPEFYSDLELPQTKTFDIEITVPDDAAAGTHTFYVSAIGDGASYGDQLVTIEVPEEVPIIANIFGYVTAGGIGLNGVYVTLYASGGSEVLTVQTDEDGYYFMGDIPNGDYTVECAVPLGFQPVTPASVDVTLEGSDIQVDFEMEAMAAGKCRWNYWWWYDQFTRYDMPDLPPWEMPEFTPEEIEGLTALIFQHFYDRDDGFAIQIETITYMGDPARPMTFDELKEIFIGPYTWSFEYQAARHIRSIMLSVAAGCRSQMSVVSADGATLSQALTYLVGLFQEGGRDNLITAVIYLQMMDVSRIIPGGVIPLDTDNIMYKEAVLADDFELRQNHPNPFNPRTTIDFSLEVNADVRLEVFDLLGRNVTTLIDGYIEAGNHHVEWNGTDATGHEVASGVYFYRIQVGDYSQTRKMVMMK
jgi:hypothetical protein